MVEAIIAVAALMVGAGASFGATSWRNQAHNAKANQLIDNAKSKADKIIDEAHKKAQSELDKSRHEIKQSEDKLSKREQILLDKIDQLDKRTDNLRKEEQAINDIKSDILKLKQSTVEKLEKIAKLSRDEAREKLTSIVEKETRQDLVGLVGKLQREAETEAEEKAEMILVSAMERMASEVSAERTVSSVSLPDDDMKGRIIGKEGRNIQSLQQATGVDILVDDTPGMIVISSFDPVRRQVARLALEMLIKDGRIHPARIEEIVAKAERQIDKEILRAGEDATRDAGVVGIPSEMVRLLGELKFRTSYGQSVLKHSVEMAQVAGMIADEIGADKRVAKISALLHDVGKAVTHRIEGKHHHIGAELARKYGMDERIAHAIEAHHDDIEATTPEAIIVRICDALSGARPGARNVSAENFAERMRDLENIATSFKGIDKAYAISAGREVRVIVKPEKIDDLSAVKLARDIANKIESTMQYPGTIKVNVIRETRAIEYAK